MKRFKSFFIAVLSISAGLALCVNSAFAQEEEPIDDGLLGQDVLGWVGLVPPKRPSIQYRERAPLVVPPSSASNSLPPPMDRTALKNKAGNWPNDPDVVAREKSRLEALLPTTKTENWEWQKGRPLRPDQLRGDHRQVTDDSPRVAARPDGSRSSVYVSPDELRRTGRKQSALATGQEPPRQTLSDPPSGYRKPTGALKNAPKDKIVREVDPASPRAMYNTQ